MIDIQFWGWFEEHADMIIQNYDDEDLINDLDNQVASYWPDLSWEIGPDPLGGCYFALSPNLNRDKLNIAKEAISCAPEMRGWRFYPTKPRKEWDGRFQFDTSLGMIEVDASTWEYSLLRYPDGVHEIYLIGEDAKSLGHDERWHAAAIVVEGILGEECVLENNLSFTLNDVPEVQLSGKQKPICELSRAFGM